MANNKEGAANEGVESREGVKKKESEKPLRTSFIKMAQHFVGVAGGRGGPSAKPKRIQANNCNCN